MVERLHVYIEGRVQGVGFRYSTCDQAVSLGLTGWVRNLADGRVEAVFEGPRAALESVLAWCREGPRGAGVAHVQAQWPSGEPEHTRFRMRY